MILPVVQALLIGALGQTGRIVVGIKKAADAGMKPGDWDWTRTGLSVLVGALAGAWAVNVSPDPWTWFAFGYAGCDAIEGLVRKAGV